MLRWGDWGTRSHALVAQMIHDGTWNAHSIEDGKIVYDEDKDSRFNGKGRYTTEQGVALKSAITTELDKEGYVQDGRLMRAYDDLLVQKHKDTMDSTFGGMDKETRGWYNYHWLGKMLGIFRSWLPARIDMFTQKPGEKFVAGDYKFVKDENGELHAEWKGLQVEGFMYTIGLLGFNIKQLLKRAETKPLNEAQKTNVARMSADLVMIGAGLLTASLIDDDEDKSKLDHEAATLLTRALQDVMVT